MLHKLAFRPSQGRYSVHTPYMCTERPMAGNKATRSVPPPPAGLHYIVYCLPACPFETGPARLLAASTSTHSSRISPRLRHERLVECTGGIALKPPPKFITCVPFIADQWPTPLTASGALDGFQSERRLLLSAEQVPRICTSLSLYVAVGDTLTDSDSVRVACPACSPVISSSPPPRDIDSGVWTVLSSLSL